MAADEALLEEAAHTGRAFLRLYRFAPPCLSFGRNEPATRRYDRAMIERLGLDVVRRPTGGRAVWHEHEVTYAVAAPASGTLHANYRAIHARLAIALRRLGVRATLAPAARARGVGAGACFDASVGGELVVGGRKVVGSAQLSRDGAFLQHGSILLDGSQALVRRVSREPGGEDGESSLSRVLGRSVTFAEVAAVVAMAFGGALEAGAGLPSAVAPGSERLAERAALFSDPTWTWRR
jgi:lipoyl(octanoyl) transferase